MLKDPKFRLQDKGVRDHGIVRIRELLDVEVLLHGSLGVTQKRPGGAQGVAELIEVERIVRADDDKPCVCDAELWITVHEIPEKAMLFGVIRSSGQMEDHRVATLELREFLKRPSLVLELVVRKGGSDFDVFSHALPFFDPLPRRWLCRLRRMTGCPPQ